MNQRTMDDENITENLEQAYLDALDSGDNAQRSVIAKLIQAEEQGLPGTQK